jgi:hypothetical protein
MKVITPTPSQAAVVLKKFLQQNGLDVQLSVAQEASARMRGYADWQAFVSDVEPRTGDIRFRASRKAVEPVVPQLFTIFRKRRLGILLLQGEIEFDDCAAKHLVLRHEIAIKSLAGQRGINVLMDAPVLSYRSKDGKHREVRVYEAYDAEYEGEGRWRLKDGTGFHIRQVSLERGTDERGTYLAPVIISFSNGDHCAGSAQYRPASGRIQLDEEVLAEIERHSQRYSNNIVETVYVEIAGTLHKAESGKGQEFFIPSEGLTDELAFGTHLKDVRIPAPTFVSFNKGPKTPVINWNPALFFGVCRVHHRPDVRTNGTFGGAGAIYVGSGKWQQDAAEAFYLYDEAGNLWTPQERDLR